MFQCAAFLLVGICGKMFVYISLKICQFSEPFFWTTRTRKRRPCPSLVLWKRPAGSLSRPLDTPPPLTLWQRRPTPPPPARAGPTSRTWPPVVVATTRPPEVDTTRPPDPLPLHPTWGSSSNYSSRRATPANPFPLMTSSSGRSGTGNPSFCRKSDVTAVIRYWHFICSVSLFLGFIQKDTVHSFPLIR
jgi:hypothetical protein